MTAGPLRSLGFPVDAGGFGNPGTLCRKYLPSVATVMVMDGLKSLRENSALQIQPRKGRPELSPGRSPKDGVLGWAVRDE
jgi:hypothetical protein